MQLKSCGYSLSAIVATSFMFFACSDYLSSSEISSSSSSVQSSTTQAKFQTWHGTDKAQQIKTGYDAGSGTSGYWYEVNDNSEGGLSKITWL